MDNLILFSDLDGTLIFSAKQKQVGDIVIERKNKEPISCITSRQAELFPKIGNVIPVTTRSIEQYRRIEFAKHGFRPRYALCDNGGTLLVDGAEDSGWNAWSAEIFGESEQEIARFRRLLENDPRRSFEVRLVDGLFLFTKSGSPEDTLKYLGEGELCECFAVGIKVYVIPKKLNKGAAVKRLCGQLEIFRENTVCAGDSLMDLSMLNYAETALFTENIPEGLVSAKNRIRLPRAGFTDFVTEFADKQE